MCMVLCRGDLGCLLPAVQQPHHVQWPTLFPLYFTSPTQTCMNAIIMHAQLRPAIHLLCALLHWPVCWTRVQSNLTPAPHRALPPMRTHTLIVVRVLYVPHFVGHWSPIKRMHVWYGLCGGLAAAFAHTVILCLLASRATRPTVNVRPMLSAARCSSALPWRARKL